MDLSIRSSPDILRNSYSAVFLVGRPLQRHGFQATLLVVPTQGLALHCLDHPLLGLHRGDRLRDGVALRRVVDHLHRHGRASTGASRRLVARRPLWRRRWGLLFSGLVPRGGFRVHIVVVCAQVGADQHGADGRLCMGAAESGSWGVVRGCPGGAKGGIHGRPLSLS